MNPTYSMPMESDKDVLEDGNNRFNNLHKSPETKIKQFHLFGEAIN